MIDIEEQIMYEGPWHLFETPDSRIEYVGDWDSFLEPTKEEISEDDFKKQRIIEFIRERHNSGNPINPRNMDSIAYNRARDLFGSYKKAVEAAGINYNSIMKLKRGKWNKEVVINKLIKMNEKGKPLNFNYANNHYTKLCTAAERYFGSWGNAVRAAGIDYDAILKVGIEKRSKNLPRVCKSRLKAETDIPKISEKKTTDVKRELAIRYTKKQPATKPETPAKIPKDSWASQIDRQTATVYHKEISAAKQITPQTEIQKLEELELSEEDKIIVDSTLKKTKAKLEEELSCLRKTSIPVENTSLKYATDWLISYKRASLTKPNYSFGPQEGPRLNVDVAIFAIASAMAKYHGTDVYSIDLKKAHETAFHMMSFFGEHEIILDNMLEVADRGAFYILEDMGLLNKRSEETTLYDGREWRVFLWFLDKDKFIKNAQEYVTKPFGMEAAISNIQQTYKELPDDAWKNNGTVATS